MTKEIKTIKLEDLGYNDFFESSRKSLELTEHSLARVTAEYRGVYRVKGIEGEYLAKVTGKQAFDAKKREDYPAVGDWVATTKPEKDKATIQGILARKTILRKKYTNKEEAQVIATNIDILFIVESMDNDYNLNRFERYLILAKEEKIKPTIILNKIDLISEEELNSRIDQIKQRFNDIDVISTSTISEEGLNELIDYIEKSKTYCFLGSSGVGKSSLINKLLKKNEIKTGEMNRLTGKGRHTTTTREMYFLENGGIVIDNPGTREVGIVETNTGIEEVFEEITDLSKDCKYSDCSHIHEPGCAVLKAIENKEIDEDKYNNYVKLRKESDHYELTNIEKRDKDRKFGKFVKKVKEELEKNK
jgi:ribosome biogenesis GTPase